VLQSLETGKLLGNYDIDLFGSIIKRVDQVSQSQVLGGSGIAYGDNFETDVSFRAIADHARAVCFLAAEGVNPGNTDRDYVLRRLIRRMIRHGRRVGIREYGFLDAAKDGVVDAMEAHYQELSKNKAKIEFALVREWELFSGTLDRGIELLDAERTKLDRANGQRTLGGNVAFKLYDTYGFPLDLTQDVLRENNIEVDVEGFNRLMEQQRARGRAARKEEAIAPDLATSDRAASHFIGNHTYETSSKVLAVQKDGESVAVVTAETPFYPEGGGQVGDQGVIETESGALLEVSDTRKAGDSILHLGRIVRGNLGDFERGHAVTMRVDRERRDAAMRNHSATHLLHYALREVAGRQVRQAGSLVEPSRLRFDFSHQGAIAERELLAIEELINERIRENAQVTTEEMAYNEALKAGALAFFGDKYGDRVRVVRMGDFSIELCGGTHVNRTGDIGLFKLDAESGVAAGVRRIEAATGRGALEEVRRREKVLEELSGRLGARDGEALERLERLLAREKELEKRLRALEQKLVAGDGKGGGDAERVSNAGGIKVVTRKFDGVDAKALRDLADRLRDKYRSAVVALGSDLGEKAALLVAVTNDLTGRIKAGDIVKTIAPTIGGTGGGRPDFAQAGGRDPGKLDEALESVVIQVAEMARDS
jgi:alanyl-tRNA synthetase